MRKFYAGFTALLMVTAFTLSVFGNPQILQKHRGKKKDGKEVTFNCNYCHGTAQNKMVEKRKHTPQELATEKARPTCKGGGCH